MDATPIRHPWAEPPGTGEVTEVAEGILWARLPLPMKLDHVNIYILDEGDGWAVVDTGMDWSSGRAAWEALLTGPLAGKPVRRVLVTHHHPDHVGLAGWFQDRGADLLMPRTEWLLARMLVLDIEDLPSDRTLAFYRAAGMRPDLYEVRRSERPFNFADCVAPMPPGHTRLVEGQRLRLGGRDWTLRMGAGHAPEHATLWRDEIVLGGDQLLPGISPNIGVFPIEPEADPLADWLAACARLAPHASDGQLVLPGHKLPFFGLPARMRQLAGNHHGALDRLRAHLAAPHSAGGSFQPIFRREIGDGEYGLALAEALAHCLHLWHRGEARRDVVDGVWMFRMA